MDAIGVIIYELLVNKEYQAFNIAVNAFYTKYRGTEIWDYVLVHAVQKNNMDIVKFVLEEKKSLKMTRFDRVVVENAMSDGNLDMVKYLVSKGGDSYRSSRIECRFKKWTH